MKELKNNLKNVPTILYQIYGTSTKGLDDECLSYYFNSNNDLVLWAEVDPSDITEDTTIARTVADKSEFNQVIVEEASKTLATGDIFGTALPKETAMVDGKYYVVLKNPTFYTWNSETSKFVKDTTKELSDVDYQYVVTSLPETGTASKVYTLVDEISGRYKANVYAAGSIFKVTYSKTAKQISSTSEYESKYFKLIKVGAGSNNRSVLKIVEGETKTTKAGMLGTYDIENSPVSVEITACQALKTTFPFATVVIDGKEYSLGVLSNKQEFYMNTDHRITINWIPNKIVETFRIIKNR